MGNEYTKSATKTVSISDYLSSTEYRTKALLSLALESGEVKHFKKAIQAVRSGDAVREMSHEKANARLLDYLTRPITFQSDVEFFEEGSSKILYKRTPLMIALDLQHIELGQYLKDEINRVKRVEMTFEKEENVTGNLTFGATNVSTPKVKDMLDNTSEKMKMMTNKLMPLDKHVSVRPSRSKNVVSAADLLADDPMTLAKMKSWSSSLKAQTGSAESF